MRALRNSANRIGTLGQRPRHVVLRSAQRESLPLPATEIIKSVKPDDHPPATVARGFRRLVERGARIAVAGSAREDVTRLLSIGYTPKHRVELFGSVFFLTNQRREDEFRFFVAYVLPANRARRPARQQVLFARIFYKDSSLIWRAASHYIDSDDDQWIGKGDLKTVWEDGEEVWASAEETTNLPLEIQDALDTISRRAGRVREDKRAISLVLRRAPDGRIRPYEDFSGPRRRAMASAADRVNGGRDVAWFERQDDPASLRFAPGFEPDLARGVSDRSDLRSRFYGGKVYRYRVLSRNREIQYGFVAAPRQVWILPAQALTTELSSFGVRTVDVHADENLYLPGYEFHYLESSGPAARLHSQIPAGFAGAPSALDPSRADTSRWNDALPVIREFRRRIRVPRR